MLYPHKELGVANVFAYIVIYQTYYEHNPVNEWNYTENSSESEGICSPHSFRGAHIMTMDTKTSEEGAEYERNNGSLLRRGNRCRRLNRKGCLQSKRSNLLTVLDHCINGALVHCVIGSVCSKRDCKYGYQSKQKFFHNTKFLKKFIQFELRSQQLPAESRSASFRRIVWP